MIKIHCLAYSRAIRLLWLMEDLGQPYDLVQYDRTESFGAPDKLQKVHPLGKSPVIEDGDLRLAESASCLRYLTRKFDDSTHLPPPDSPAFIHHEELLDYVESSFAPACMAVMLPMMQGKEPPEDAVKGLNTHLTYIADHLSPDALLFGQKAMLADIQLSYLLANLDTGGALSAVPRVQSYWEKLQQQPGYQAAINAAGPMAPPS